MKSRLSYFLISGIIILSIFTGIFIWRNKHLKQIPKLNEKSFNAPISSKYIPPNADFIFHWKVNPTNYPKQIGTNQDKVNKKINFIRDSSFKLISLDFAKDISKWAGDYGSFAVLDSDKKLLNDWIMVLGIKDDVNIKEELESILEKHFMEESINLRNGLNTSSTGIISKKINSNHSIYFAKEKDNVLIASNPKIIQSSIDQSDRDRLNTKENYKDIQLMENLKDGLLLLEISPKKIFNLIGQEDNLLELNETKNLITSINIDKNKLNLEGIISYYAKNQMPSTDINYNLVDMKKEPQLSDDFILIDNPNQYFGNGSNHPYQKLIASIIQKSTTSDYSNLFKIILEHSKGNLIWINDKGWLVLTRKSDTSKNEISNILHKDNFLNSNLEFQKRKLEVWSKISTSENERYEIKENIEAIFEEEEGNYIWGQSIFPISNVDNIKYLPNYLDSDHKTDEINDFDDILRIHLGKEKAETMLNNFYPYILFKTMLGNTLNPPQNIDISIAVPTINYPDFIKFKINLQTS